MGNILGRATDSNFLRTSPHTKSQQEGFLISFSESFLYSLWHLEARSLTLVSILYSFFPSSAFDKLMGDKKKAGALFVRLVSAAGTGFFYVKKKTKKLQTTQTKLEFRKFDPRVNRHVLFKEEKMK
ncbi:uncharacterized protein LOC107818795 [Nicotiana tabacum]|uniref:Uncharacterized protein LOC107818795 n=1 Tax=Nicotiana tabacum TaxID=4097 RepID=A0AC58SKU7_TOBAC|nr:uncharacterized protein LOC104107975 isoform X1 [Nicotiana tomentosiformis]